MSVLDDVTNMIEVVKQNPSDDRKRSTSTMKSKPTKMAKTDSERSLEQAQEASEEQRENRRSRRSSVFSEVGTSTDSVGSMNVPSTSSSNETNVEDEEPNSIQPVDEENQYDIDEGLYKNKEPLEAYVGTDGAKTVSSWLDLEIEEKPVISRIEGRPDYVLLSEYIFEISESCVEAMKGNNVGSHKLKWCAPGFPKKKLGTADYKKHGYENDDWVIQGLYPAKEKSKSKGWKADTKYYLFVVYEGWTSETGENRSRKELKETASDLLKEFDKRQDIIEAIRSASSDDKKQCKFRDARNMWGRPDSIFWCYEDVAYHINALHKEENLGPIFFLLTDAVSSQTLQSKFPNFEYTTKMVIDDAVLPRLENSDSALQVNADMKKRIKMVRRNMYQNSCTSDDCLCFVRWYHMKSTRQKGFKFLRYNRRGMLIMDKLNMSHGRVVIECSDVCGCDDSCPTRQCQKGQQVHLVFSYEGKKGFGVRAGEDISKGQFIIEYLGVLKVSKEGEIQPKYVMEIVTLRDNVTSLSNDELMLIDATDKGNMSRYFNHSCDPNAFIVEVHTRRRETDLLVPRACYYACKDIKKGEEICVSYWGPEKLDETAKAKKGHTTCDCGTEICKGFIPAF